MFEAASVEAACRQVAQQATRYEPGYESTVSASHLAASCEAGSRRTTVELSPVSRTSNRAGPRLCRFQCTMER
eukprot:2896846-Prymnesium_polylepis.1